jgi:hypothetical protein
MSGATVPAEAGDDAVPVQPAKAATASIMTTEAMNNLLISIEDHLFSLRESCCVHIFGT